MLRALPLPVHPDTEILLGYEMDPGFRYVGFHMDGEDLIVDDGETYSTSGNWRAWLVLTGHPKITPHIHQYNFGSIDRRAEHHLILDRRRRRWYVEEADKAAAFLRIQHLGRPRQPKVVVPGEESAEQIASDFESLRRHTARIAELANRQLTVEYHQLRQHLADDKVRLEAFGVWIDEEMEACGKRVLWG